MRWCVSVTGLSGALLLQLFLSAASLSGSDHTRSQLSGETRRSFVNSLNELALLAAEQEQLLSEAGEELDLMRELLSDSQEKRNELERSLTSMSKEIERLSESNRNSQADSRRLSEALTESEDALESLNRSWKRYRRSVRIQLWSERVLAASLVVGAFALGLSL